MQKPSSEITKFIAAAKALGAPLFGLDLLLRGAEAAEAALVKANEEKLEQIDTDSLFAPYVPSEKEAAIEADLKALEAASSSAWTLVAVHFFPDSIRSTLYTDYGNLTDPVGTEVNEALLVGYDVANRWVKKA